MAAWLDNVRFNPTLGGTTDWTYSSAIAGYQSPAAAGAVNGVKYKYFAIDASNNWELGEGAWNSTAPGTLPRTTILANSLGTTAKINFASAPQVAIVALKEDMISVEEANSFTTTQQAQARSNINANVAITTTTNALAADVSLTSSGVFVDGPSAAQGTTGTFIAFGTVTVVDTNAATFNVKLWDGTTVIASAQTTSSAAGLDLPVALSGLITNPASNIRISVADTNGTPAGKIKASIGAGNTASSLTVIRTA